MKWIGAWLLMYVVEVLLVAKHAAKHKWTCEEAWYALIALLTLTGIAILGIWCIVDA